MKKNNVKKLSRVFLVLMVATVICCVFATGVFASEEATTTAAGMGTAQGLGMLAAALSTGLAGIGSGIAVAAGAPAAIGALTEDAKTFGKSLIFVVLGEGIALYGMLISILILNKF